MVSAAWLSTSMVRKSRRRRLGARRSRLNLVFWILCAAGSAFADPRPPLPPFPEQVLSRWRFNDTEEWSSKGTAPISVQNVQWLESWSGHSVLMAGTEPSLLAWPLVTPDGHTNLAPAYGTLRFWFAPNWTSANEGGAGPGTEARLLELGAWDGSAAQGWWTLSVNAAGTELGFFARGDGEAVPLLRAPIAWCAADWHQVALSWSVTGTLIHVDGESVAKGPGVALEPLERVLEMGGTGYQPVFGGNLPPKSAAGW